MSPTIASLSPSKEFPCESVQCLIELGNNIIFPSFGWRKNVDELELFEKEPKGELTVVISERKIKKNISKKLTESDMNIIKKMINKLPTREITDILTQISDVSKKEIYNYCLELKNEK